MVAKALLTLGLHPMWILILLFTSLCLLMVKGNANFYFCDMTKTIHIAAGETAWTTRFGIVAKDGDTLVPEPEKTQPTGTWKKA